MTTYLPAVRARSSPFAAPSLSAFALSAVETESRHLSRARFLHLLRMPAVSVVECVEEETSWGTFLFITLHHGRARSALVCHGLGITHEGLLDTDGWHWFPMRRFANRPPGRRRFASMLRQRECRYPAYLHGEPAAALERVSLRTASLNRRKP